MRVRGGCRRRGVVLKYRQPLVNTSADVGAVQPVSDHDALDLVDRHRIRRPIVELRRLG